MVIIDFGYFFTSTAPVASALVSLACNTPTLSRSCSSWWTAECWHECWRSYTKIYIIEHTCIYIYIYTPGKPYGHFFLSIMGFTRNGLFFFQLRILVFDCEGLLQFLWQHRVRTSSDSLQKRNFSPKWSKLGVVIKYPNLATNTAIFPTKFGCTHKILDFFQHHVEKKQ